jgi:beta-mannanase
MKRVLAIAVLITLATQLSTQAQAPPPAQKSLASTMNIYVFPTQGQVANVQSQDEAACYSWAVQNSGVDPFQLNKQAQQQMAAAQQQSAAAEGQAIKTGAKGAAAGALIGGIAGDAGTGAKVGAATGLVAGRAKRKAAQGQAAQQQASTQQATAQQMDNFKKAFSVCLEGKHYMVKY